PPVSHSFPTRRSSDLVLAGKPLEGDVAIAVELEAHDIEIEQAAADGEIGAPPVLDAIVFDEAIGHELADLVRSRSQRDIERRFVDRKSTRLNSSHSQI